ncbi:MAG: hypothetical protein K5672_06525 [Bacteroidaceae bacterium]|nr:hypothetical protein [Bacteroidaceae bacterium]
MAYKNPLATMRRIIFLLFTFCLSAPASSQNPISIERIINDLNWGNCSESDVIIAFKDNVTKREHEEVWDGGLVSTFVLRNIRIGRSVSDANIIVNKYNRKLVKIGGIMLGKDYDWSKGVDEISKELEDYFSSFWGVEHKKSIEYDTDFDDEKTVYTNISCEWGDTYKNNKPSKGTFHLLHRAKIIVIAIEPK